MKYKTKPLSCNVNISLTRCPFGLTIGGETKLVGTGNSCENFIYHNFEDEITCKLEEREKKLKRLLK